MHGDRRRRPRVAMAGAALVALSAALAACGGTSPSPVALPTANPDAGPVGPLRAPGGPFLVDRLGRTVLLHGVNLVYKVAPYEVVASGKGANVLTVAQVRHMAALGFDVVRLGIIWKGLEPGRAGINDPAICQPGTPRAGGPGQFDQAVFDRYLSRLDATVALLARYGISSLIDMHQDVYNEAFAGEGAPDWAVCTDGITPAPVHNVPDWSVNYQGPGVVTAYQHLWTNDVVGDLQGELDTVWAKVAAHFRSNPWVVGYDPFNEPYGEDMPPNGNSAVFDAELECFYTGTAHPGLTQDGQTVSCPPDDPAEGVIPRIEAADPNHLVFYEGNYATDSGVPNHIGPMPFPRLVLNFHDYCFLHVPNGPEPADFGSTCAPLEKLVFTQHDQERAVDTTAEQPGGPAWQLTEFGASNDTADLARIVGDADADLVGWIYWQWIRYPDPTGAAASGLSPPTAATPAKLQVLGEPYAEAVAGTPTAMAFDAAGDRFTLSYRPAPGVRAPTVVAVPLAEHYPHGYCARADGARVTSAPGSSRLDLVNRAGADTVSLTVTAGRC